MGNVAEIPYGERARVTGGEYEGQVAEVEEYFEGPQGGHYFVYVGGMFVAVPAKFLERV